MLSTAMDPLSRNTISHTVARGEVFRSVTCLSFLKHSLMNRWTNARRLTTWPRSGAGASSQRTLNEIICVELGGKASMAACCHTMWKPLSSSTIDRLRMQPSRSCYLTSWLMLSGLNRPEHLKSVLLVIRGQTGCGSSGIAARMSHGHALTHLTKTSASILNFSIQ